MAKRPKHLDMSSAILDLNKVVTEGKLASTPDETPLKSVLAQLENRLSALPEDKSVLILNEVIRLVDNMSEPDDIASDDMTDVFNRNIRSSVEAVITNELENWIRHRLPQVFSETVSAQLSDPKAQSDKKISE
jgi:hypothetical protein